MKPRVQVPTGSAEFSDLQWPTKTLVVGATRHRPNLILALLCAAQFMLILDIAIVNVALPSMQRTLGLSAENIQWVVGGYAVTFGGFLMLGGRLADIVGRLLARCGPLLPPDCVEAWIGKVGQASRSAMQ